MMTYRGRVVIFVSICGLRSRECTHIQLCTGAVKKKQTWYTVAAAPSDLLNVHNVSTVVGLRQVWSICGLPCWSERWLAQCSARCP